MTDKTIAAYDAHASVYRDAHHHLPAHLRSELDAFAARVGAGGRVLEIGSGGGRDAAHLEAQGLRVRSTDVTPAFVDLLRRAGFPADVVDPRTDPLEDPARPDALYDAVWANACLLHVLRADLPTVLARLAAATRPGGVLRFSVIEGEGEVWWERGPVVAPRRFVRWWAPDLRAAVQQAGWAVRQVERVPGAGEDVWLEVWAARSGS